MAFRKLFRQCLPSSTSDNVFVDLNDLSVEERLRRIKDSVTYMLKSGDTTKHSQTLAELESLRNVILEDIIITNAEDLMLYTNCTNFKIVRKSKRSSSMTDIDKIALADCVSALKNCQLPPRRAFSIPDNMQYTGSVEEKKHKRLFQRMWTSVKKFFSHGKRKNSRYAGLSAVLQNSVGLNCDHEVYCVQESNVQLSCDVNDKDELLVHDQDITIKTAQENIGSDIMSCGDAGICINENQKLDDDQDVKQYDYTDLTEHEAYDIAYGVQKVGTVLSVL